MYLCSAGCPLLLPIGTRECRALTSDKSLRNDFKGITLVTWTSAEQHLYLEVWVADLKPKTCNCGPTYFLIWPTLDIKLTRDLSVTQQEMGVTWNSSGRILMVLDPVRIGLEAGQVLWNKVVTADHGCFKGRWLFHLGTTFSDGEFLSFFVRKTSQWKGQSYWSSDLCWISFLEQLISRAVQLAGPIFRRNARLPIIGGMQITMLSPPQIQWNFTGWMWITILEAPHPHFFGHFEANIWTILTFWFTVCIVA